MNTIDVLGLGSVALDEILRVDDWPAADEKRRVRQREQRLGGLTGHALAAAARYGARCAYAGRLGTDADSKHVEFSLVEAGIDTSHALIDAQFGVVRSTIIAAQRDGTRNVFSHPASHTGAHESQPSADIIAKARVLFVDHHGVTGSIRAAKIARNAGRPVVGDLERADHPDFPALLDLIDHLILSASFACQVAGTANAKDAAAALWKSDRAVVIVTCGEDGSWICTSENQAPVHHGALHVHAVDTTGCGDVFHGVYAASLAAGDPLPTRVHHATIAAGLKAAGEALPHRNRLEACPK